MKSLPRSHDTDLASADLISDDARSLPVLLGTDDVDLIGQSLNGTYIVESVIGEGGMGRVYQARHARIASKKLAVKVLRSEFARNTEVIARFRREAETAAGITHPNVVGVYDVDVTVDGHFYLVCEHLTGIDLAERLSKQKRLDVPQAIHVIVQVCRALEAAVARGVVHRDLKPHNVFLLADQSGTVSDRPDVKVLDFGLSRVMDTPGTQLTRTGVIMGTPAYMAPEQAQGTGVDHRTDVYGVGAVLFAALTGRPPYEAETLQGVVLAVLTGEAPQPRALNPEIPENLELVMQRAMARKPEDRYQTMTALREALEPFAGMDERLAEPSGKKSSGADVRAMLQADARAVSLARPRLLLFGLLAVALLVVGLASALPSIELMTGTLRFTRVEVVLALLAITGTLLTPAVLLMRLVKKTIWNNHARVLELLESVRGAVVWAVVSYGAGSLAVRFLADVASRFDLLLPIGHSAQSGWSGWNLLLLVVALIMAVVTVVRLRLARRGGIVGWLAPALFAGGVLLSALVISLGFAWQRGSERAVAVAAEKPAAPPAPELPVARGDAPVKQEAAAAAPSAPPLAPPEIPPTTTEAKIPGPRAPSDELAKASEKGVDGLGPLAERYPTDPAVLRALLLAFASRANGLVDAMTIAQRLFAVAPEQAADKDVRFLVKRAAATPGQASAIAFPLMVESMGSAGPDLLYELTLIDARAAPRADELLASEAVREKATPALLIANDLRKAVSCSARVPLLERAAAVGDERSAAILAPLGATAKKGCGKKKKQPCPAACPAEGERFLETVATIRSRLAAKTK